MTVVAEELEISRWIRTTVQNDATLMGLLGAGSGAFAEVIPNDVELPAVRYSLVSGEDKMVVNGVRIMTTCLYRIVVTNKGPSFAPIVAAVARLDEILHRQQGNTPTATILACIREEPFRFTEVQDQEIYTHAGGLYRVQAQAT